MGEVHRGGFTLDNDKPMDEKGNWVMKDTLTAWQMEMNGKFKKLTDDIHGIQMQLGRLEKKVKEKMGTKPEILE